LLAAVEKRKQQPGLTDVCVQHIPDEKLRRAQNDREVLDRAKFINAGFREHTIHRGHSGGRKMTGKFRGRHLPSFCRGFERPIQKMAPVPTYHHRLYMGTPADIATTAWIKYKLHEPDKVQLPVAGTPAFAALGRIQNLPVNFRVLARTGCGIPFS
jgi:hypothetical protein